MRTTVRSATVGPVLELLDPDNVVEACNIEEKMKKVFCLSSKASFILSVTVTQNKEIRVQTTTLIDLGAYAVFVHHRFVKEHGLKTNTLGKVIHLYNADGSRNRSKTIEEYVWLDVAVGFHVSQQACLVTDLGNKDMFLGFSYLRRHNPEID